MAIHCKPFGALWILDSGNIMGFAMARLFISQDRLESWTEEDRVRLDGDTLYVNELDKSFSIKSAVRFMNVAGSDPDEHGLVGKVKEEAELLAMGAELVSTSVLLGDTAYDVQLGFVGKVMPS